MKFIFFVEEQGYQLHYWDEINNQVGKNFVTSWNIDDLYYQLSIKGFNITKKELSKAIKIIDEQPFVILKSIKKDKSNLDILENTKFVIEE